MPQKSYFYLIPLSLSILFAIKVIVINSLAIQYGHAKPLFPYLSDSGSTHPEAGYFSLLVTLEGVLVGVLGWIRYKQIRYVCAHSMESNNNDKLLDENQCQRILKFNKYGLYLFVAIMLSMVAVAALRSTEHLIAHCLAANPLFICYYIEIGIQTWISYQLIPRVNSLKTARFRLIAIIIIYVLAIIFLISLLVSFFQLKVPFDKVKTMDRLWWDQSWGGYDAHVISAIGESLFIFMASPFFASFVTEFKRIRTNNGRLEYEFLK